MKKGTKVILYIAILNSLLLFGFFKKPPSLTFGYGLGDIILLVLYQIIFISFYLWSYYVNKRSQNIKLLIILCMLLLIILTLNITLFRGSEFPLSQGFFYNQN